MMMGLGLAFGVSVYYTMVRSDRWILKSERKIELHQHRGVDGGWDRDSKDRREPRRPAAPGARAPRALSVERQERAVRDGRAAAAAAAAAAAHGGGQLLCGEAGRGHGADVGRQAASRRRHELAHARRLGLGPGLQGSLPCQMRRLLLGGQPLGEGRRRRPRGLSPGRRGSGLRVLRGECGRGLPGGIRQERCRWCCGSRCSSRRLSSSEDSCCGPSSGHSSSRRAGDGWRRATRRDGGRRGPGSGQVHVGWGGKNESLSTTNFVPQPARQVTNCPH